jgi:hypothetical protein
MQYRSRCRDSRVMVARERLTADQRYQKEAALASKEPLESVDAPSTSPDDDDTSLSEDDVASTAGRELVTDFVASALQMDSARQTDGFLMGSTAAASPASPVASTSSAAEHGTATRKAQKAERVAGEAAALRREQDEDPFNAWSTIDEPLTGEPYNEMATKLSEAREIAEGASARRRRRLERKPPNGSAYREEHEALLEDEDDEEGEVPVGGVKVFAYGVQASLVRQAAGAVDARAAVRLVSRVTVRAQGGTHAGSTDRAFRALCSMLLAMSRHFAQACDISAAAQHLCMSVRCLRAQLN